MNDSPGPDPLPLPSEPLLTTSDAVAPALALTGEEAREVAEVLVEIGPPERLTDREVAEALIDGPE